MDKEKLIEGLNDDLANELSAMVQYFDLFCQGHWTLPSRVGPVHDGRGA